MIDHETEPASPPKTADKLFAEHLQRRQVNADRALAVLLVLQWAFAILCAVCISPYTWDGANKLVHMHVWSAVIGGGLLTVFPVFLAYYLPGHRLTRIIMALAQVQYSSLLIHLMGGRIESHFHVFGSLAFLAFYKDPWVYLPAVSVISLDHLVRAMFWPESVFGVLSPSPLRALEHAGWVLFETFFLIMGVRQNRLSLWELAKNQSSLTQQRDLLEQRVRQRTAEIEQQKRIQETILQRIPAAVFWRDTDGVFIGCNEMFSDFFGLKSPGEIIGKRMNDIILPCDQTNNRLSSFCDAPDENVELVNVEEQLHNAHGERRTVLAGATSLHDHEHNCFGTLGSFLDVTSLKHAESRAKSLAHLIQESPNELYIIDAETLRLVEANQGFLASIGLDESRLATTSPEDFLKEMSNQDLRQRIAVAMTDPLGRCAFNTVHVRKDGSTFPVHVDYHRSTFENRPVYVAFCTDLSDSQAMERQLAQAQKLESMGQLAAGIAHEINTPMQCVSGNVEFLTVSYERLFNFNDALFDMIKASPSGSFATDDLDKLCQQYRYDVLRQQTPDAIDEASNAVMRVIEIVRAMKAMSHPGKQEMSEVDINTLVRQATIICRNRYKFIANLNLELCDELPMVPAFAAEMSQVFINLIVNAADAIAERKESEDDLEGQITISTSHDENQVEIRVQDNGTGMSEDVRSKVFHQFFTTKDVGKGTGLGLSLTYNIVTTKHNGSIHVESEPGQGSAFVLTLPLDCDQPVMTDDSSDRPDTCQVPVLN
ncbi:PAS domain-containing sensor histidine kinase [Rhodopirellula halodulae]|uniref:PAS domain-containing sensor histidine kinase n=1 Tax=Rhodopirellula halodulae TaxID=2894198 RepID=UPI001E374122|nr:ATP-binding protein [Rhodopirellula sp. JC737]MCC9656214.1 PAS domain S-box protein [Rhodopirellula sp. JC737]